MAPALYLPSVFEARLCHSDRFQNGLLNASADTVRQSPASPHPMKITFEINLVLGSLQLTRHLLCHLSKDR
jgi:hypothetical protein